MRLTQVKGFQASVFWLTLVLGLWMIYCWFNRFDFHVTLTNDRDEVLYSRGCTTGECKDVEYK